LMPKFIGPYKVLKSKAATSNYILELPEELQHRGIHPKFHVSRLRPHVQNDDLLFPLGGVGRRKHSMNESFWCPPFLPDHAPTA
jgi:hypothetical protein